MTVAATRRALLAGAAAAPLAAPMVTRAAEATAWTMVMPWPRDAPGVFASAERFAAMVGAMSGGRLTITLHAGGELVPPMDAMGAVQRGEADLLHGSPYFWDASTPALDFFTTLPFGMTATEHGAWLRFGGGLALWRELYERFDAVPFLAGSSGVQAGGWFTRPVASAADIAGLRLRMAGLGGRVMVRLGAEIVSLPPQQIAEALASGTLDGADWIGPWNDLAMGLDRVASHYYMPGWHEPGAAVEVTVARRSWEALAPDLRAIVEAAAAATAEATLAEFTYNNATAFPRLAANGVEVAPFPDDLVDRCRALSREVVAEIAGTDALSRRIHDSHMAFLAVVRAYSPHGEGGYLALR